MSVFSHIADTVLRGYAYSLGVSVYKDIHERISGYLKPEEDDIDTEEIVEEADLSGELPDFD